MAHLSTNIRKILISIEVYRYHIILTLWSDKETTINITTREKRSWSNEFNFSTRFQKFQRISDNPKPKSTTTRSTKSTTTNFGLKRRISKNVIEFHKSWKIIYGKSDIMKSIALRYFFSNCFVQTTKSFCNKNFIGIMSVFNQRKSNQASCINKKNIGLFIYCRNKFINHFLRNRLMNFYLEFFTNIFFVVSNRKVRKSGSH